MALVVETTALSHEAVMIMLAAGIAKAEEIGAPQCIVIVDTSGEPWGEIRMNGARFLSRRSALAKARTAVGSGVPSANIPEGMQLKLAAATGGQITGLVGGYPIRIDGKLVGGIGVGSGTPDQDMAVAEASLAAVGAEVP